MNNEYDPHKELAVIMTKQCVRNTIIEKYHSEGKLTDEEMKAFNKEVADNLYTFLTYMFDRPPEVRDQVLLTLQKLHSLPKWDEPEFRGKKWFPNTPELH